MSLLLTQFFPNNNYTARHQNLIGQKNMKKKIKNHDASHSPQRGSHKNSNSQFESANVNLANMKMRMLNAPNGNAQQAYL